MVIIDDDIVGINDFENSQTSINDIFEEITQMTMENNASMAEMSWTMYGLLPVGTILQADTRMERDRKVWSAFGAFEYALFERPTDPNEWTTIFPEIKKGDTIMFLGMTEHQLPYERTVYDHHVTAHRRRTGYRGMPPRGRVVSESRKYPKWLVGEKTYIYALPLKLFKVLKMGTGGRQIDDVLPSKKEEDG